MSLVSKLLLTFFVLFMSCNLYAQQEIPNAKYISDYRDSVLDRLYKQSQREQEIRDSITAKIRARLNELKMEEERKDFIFDFGGVEKPSSPEEFDAAFHLPPEPQYRTGTCWCFAGISFLETEINRLTGREIKLSEMYVVYYEYLEKVRHFINTRGEYWLSEGGALNSTLHIMREYGLIPATDYSGLVRGDLYDHSRMAREIREYLDYVKQNNYWDEDKIIASVKIILDDYMGQPPQSINFEGKEMTPRDFVERVLKLNADDYIDAMSTMAKPFHEQHELEVYDNWRHDSTYWNLPLDEWYHLIKTAVENGYTVAQGGDVSEPGYSGFKDAAVVAPFDIEIDKISQASREMRIYNRTTRDDHGNHIVGYKRINGHDWYLIKDSNRSSRWGEYKGYMFYRGDYVRLKMLSVLVHKSALKIAFEKEHPLGSL